MREPIYVTKPVLPPLEEYVRELSDIWDSRILTNMGAKCQALEAALRDMSGTRYFYAFANGHLALEAALQVLGLPAGGEVITTPYTFASTTMAILRSGLVPVFCDVKPDDCTMDPGLIEGLVTERTCAVMPVHVYGNLCDTHAIAEIAGRRGLRVVYDAAHAFGVTKENCTSKESGAAARVSGASKESGTAAHTLGVSKENNTAAGSFGDLSMFSFHATKAFHTFEGGGLAFDDPETADRLTEWRNFGYRDGEVAGLGGNAKMSEAHAAMGLCVLRHIDEYIAARKRVTEMYTERLDGLAGLTVVRPQNGVRHNYSYFPVMISEAAFGMNRDGLADALAAENVFARKYFHPLTSEMPPCVSAVKADTPVAARIAGSVLTLPLYPELKEEDVERICGIIRKAARN